MTEKNDSYRGTRILVIVAALMIIIGGIHEAQSVLSSILIAVFLAAIGTPSILWLEKQRIPYAAAVMLVVAGIAAVLAIFGVLVGTSLENFYLDLPYYQERLQKDVSSIQAYLASKGIPFKETFLLEEIIPEAVKNQTARVLTTLGSVLFEIVVILLIAMFILLEASSFPDKLRAILGNPVKDFHLFMQFVYDINRYMIIKTAMSLTVGLSIGLWLALLGVDFPLLWGFLAFLLHYVPNVGALIASIPAVLVALLQLGIGRAALAASGYLAVNFMLGNVVEPMLMGRRLGLSTLVVFLSLIFWGGLLGFVGVVLCVPLTMSLKFACENSKSAQWIAVLLGPGMSPAQFSSTQKEGTGTS